MTKRFKFAIIIKNILNSLLGSMKNNGFKTDECVEYAKIKSDNHNKLVTMASKDSKSIVKIQQPSGVYFTTVVKKQHGFNGKHKQTHYQQCLLLAFKKMGVFHLGFIIKSGGLPDIQNFQQIIQNSLPITKCRDIESISDREIAFFFHQNDSTNQWKFKFCQKEIKQKWMVLLMILAYQKEYKSSVVEIFNEQMLVDMSNTVVNENVLVYEKAKKLFQAQLIQKNSFLQNRNNELQSKLNQKLAQTEQLERNCQNLKVKVKEIENLNLILGSQKEYLKRRIIQLAQKLHQNQTALSKIQDYWLTINHQKALLSEQKKKFSEITNSLRQREQFQILSEICDQGYEIVQEKIQKNINQLQQKQNNKLKELGCEINSSKLALELFLSEFNKTNTLNPEKNYCQ